MSPVEELRAAAVRIRVLAGEVPPGPWYWDGALHNVVRNAEETVVDVHEGFGLASVGRHIALWDPAVALLVADLLDKEAGLGNTGTALALARAILGSAS